jgi:hypothetical protein
MATVAGLLGSGGPANMTDSKRANIGKTGNQVKEKQVFHITNRLLATCFGVCPLQPINRVWQ